MSAITEFYTNHGVDGRGRTLEQILNQDFDELEQCHCQIQWLFPLPEPSAFYEDAPILTKDDIEVLSNDPVAKGNIARSFSLMLSFYGLRYGYEYGYDKEGDSNIELARFECRQRHTSWLTPRNHNYLRLTRIMRFLTLVGQRKLAFTLLRCLENLYKDHSDLIGETTLKFWQKAVNV